MSSDRDAEIVKLTQRWGRERNSRLQAEAIAERGLRELYDRKQQLELVGEIASAANATGSLEDVIRFSLAKICQASGWQVGHAYLADPHCASLHSTGIWYGSEPNSLRIFHSATEETDLDPGEGLPGRAMQSRQPAWIPDLSADPNFPRAKAACKSGLKAGFAFPILAGSEVVAVLEFFACAFNRLDEFFLKVMAQIGTQLGRVAERRRNEEQLIHEASHDPLTSLPNRALFLDRLTRAVARHKRNPAASFAVLFIDLDRFKVINDSLGHIIGDSVIIEAAKRLSAALGRDEGITRAGLGGAAYGLETLARLGGDEFTILLDDLRDISDAVRVAERIQECFALPFDVEGHEIYLTASIGIAGSDSGYESADQVVRDADLAMYRAKNNGKARFEIYDQEMFAAAVNRLALENQLRRALANHEFICHYQPIIELASGQIVGFEALVRWRRSETELWYPDSFISVAEDTGLIVMLDRWVLREACRTTHAWNQTYQGSRPLSISVNVSARQFAQEDLASEVLRIIKETGIAPEMVRLEITESVSMNDVERTAGVLSDLRKMGVRFSLDDFGTGFSSLSHLHRLPLDVLKIDRSFIRRMGQDAESLAIVRTILKLARSLGMEVVAEGTETAEDVAKLTSLKCGFGQGYFFSRPVDPLAAAELLRLDRQSHELTARAADLMAT